jgi:hypothetical protein
LNPSKLSAFVVLGAVSALAQSPVQEFQLPSGLNCILVESHERPLIRMELTTRWDGSELPSGKEGLGGFLARVLDAGGAGPYSRSAFNQALDDLGMRFTFQAQVDAYRWTLVADSRSQETAMELLADAVVRPAFSGPQAEGQRQGFLKQSANLPLRERAKRRFLWEVGERSALFPPVASPLDRIEFQDLLDFQRRVIRPEASTLALYGDLNLSQAKQLVLMHLGIWGPGPQAPVPGIPAKASALPAPKPRSLAVLESRPGAELWAGSPKAEVGGTAVEVLLPILLSRTARAFFGGMEMAFRLDPGGQTPLLIKAKVAQAHRDGSPAGFLAGLEGLRTRGFTREDLAFARIQWEGENVALPLHPEALLRRIVDGRAGPALEQAVQRVTVAEVNQALKTLLAPDRLHYLLLGADAPLVQAAEKAGLGPTVLLGTAE